MNNFIEFKKSAIRYWERRRLAYNLALVIPSCLGYFLSIALSAGVGDPQQLPSQLVILLFLLCAIGANICYSFCYSLEFLFGSDNQDSLWLQNWRPFFFVCGIILSMILSFLGGREIGLIVYP